MDDINNQLKDIESKQVNYYVKLYEIVILVVNLKSTPNLQVM